MMKCWAEIKLSRIKISHDDCVICCGMTPHKNEWLLSVFGAVQWVIKLLLKYSFNHFPNTELHLRA